MEQTIRSVVDAAYLPLSIIIIGIGNCDFSKMVTLDGDDGLIDSAGRRAKRDLVQFVAFNEFKGNPQKLAEKVLEELPSQLCEYMRFMNIQPEPPQIVDVDSLKWDSGVQSLARNMANTGKIYFIIFLY